MQDWKISSSGLQIDFSIYISHFNNRNVKTIENVVLLQQESLLPIRSHFL